MVIFLYILLPKSFFCCWGGGGEVPYVPIYLYTCRSFILVTNGLHISQTPDRCKTIAML